MTQVRRPRFASFTAVRAGRGNIPVMLDLPIPPEWMAGGLCAQTDSAAFFPEKGGSTREAKRICQGCEVRDECLEYALENGIRFGVWGGLSELERRKLKPASPTRPQRFFEQRGAQVRAMAAEGTDVVVIAERFGLSVTQVRNILRRRLVKEAS
jgi:WhiB family redox-sensing transcriptional regulator